MKKFCLVIFFLAFSSLILFGQDGAHNEIDYLLFIPNSGNSFVDETGAANQLDSIANYLKGLDRVYGKIYVYGYSAYAVSDIDPVDLSIKRALFVINELKRRGVSGDLFADPVGHGSVNTWGSNDAEENKAPNRRVRILIDGTIFIHVPLIDFIPLTEEERKEQLEKNIKENIDTLKYFDSSQDAAKAAKEKSDFKFPWWILLLLLLIPLLFILLKGKKKKDKPVSKEVLEQKPAAPKPKPQPAEEIIDLEKEILRRSYFRSQSHAEYSDVYQDWYETLPKVRAEYEAKGYQTYIENGVWWAKKTIRQK